MQSLHKSLSVFLFSLVCLNNVAQADGLLVVGLDGSSMEWRLYSQPNGKDWRVISTEDEPRTPVFHGATRQILYADSLGNIRLIPDGGIEKVVFPANKNATFTQPEFDAQATNAYLVGLKDGASVDTDIVLGDLATGVTKTVVMQRSAQFEPFATADGLYYSSVSCVPPSCHRIIEDIWHIDPITREARQLTMLNAISREPVVDALEEKIYFISDKTGQFQLYQSSDNQVSAITESEGPVSSPGIDRHGDIVYIQRGKNQKDALYRWSNKTQSSEEMSGPLGVIKLRDLSVWLSD